MSHRPRIYLDNAATSWPKPECVYDAVDRYQRWIGAPAGRGVYSEAAEVDRAVQAARRSVGVLLGVTNPRRIVFCANGTDALNLAIHGVLRAGDHVVTSVWEHNSVLRPLRKLRETLGIEVTLIPSAPDAPIDPAHIERALTPRTRMVILSHASNVTGVIQPAREVGRIARQHGAIFLLDAAQTAGELPIDVQDLQVDLLAAPGHKGMLGPLGTGILYVREGMEAHVESLRQGGTGSQSDLDQQPVELPDKYESGNLNVPGILGLGAAANWLAERGLDAIRQHTRDLTARMLQALAAMPAANLHGPLDADQRMGIVSLTVDGFDSQEIAATLDASFGVQVRPGIHCAPQAHRTLGTLDQGGTVRLSVAPLVTSQQIDDAMHALAQLASG